MNNKQKKKTPAKRYRKMIRLCFKNRAKYFTAQYLALGFGLIIFLSIIGFLMYSSDTPKLIATENQEILNEQPISAKLKLDSEMKVASAYIKKITKQKPKITNYMAYSIVTKSRKQNMPIDLVVGLMHVESFFNPFAISSVKAVGLMQVFDKGIGCSKKTGKCKILFDQSRLFDVGYNIECGLQIFKSKIDAIESNRAKKKNRKKKYRMTVLEEALLRYVGGDPKYVEDVKKRRHEFNIFSIKRK